MISRGDCNSNGNPDANTHSDADTDTNTDAHASTKANANTYTNGTVAEQETLPDRFKHLDLLRRRCPLFTSKSCYRMKIARRTSRDSHFYRCAKWGSARDKRELCENTVQSPTKSNTPISII